MMKRRIVTLLAMVALVLSSVSIQAKSLEATRVNDLRSIQIDSTLKITKHADGRVVPIQDVEKLSKGQIEKILREMSVSDEEINNFPLEFKKNLVKRGGKKVKLTTNLTHKFHDSDGNEIIVDDTNTEAIEKIKKKEREKAVTISGMDSVSDGIFSAQSYVFYLGKTSNGAEFKYDYYTSYEWDGVPNFYFHDSIAQSWQYHTNSVSQNGSHNRKAYCHWNTADYYPMDITPKIGGTHGSFDLYGSGCMQWGAIHDEVTIPVIHNGQTGRFIASYAHPYSTGIVDAVLNYLGINWDGFVGDEWDLDNTFTIGQ